MISAIFAFLHFLAVWALEGARLPLPNVVARLPLLLEGARELPAAEEALEPPLLLIAETERLLTVPLIEGVR